MNNLGRLPSELLSVILNHVDNKNDIYQCTLINKSFYTESVPLLWRDLTIGTKDTLIKITSELVNLSPDSSSSPGHLVRNVSMKKSRKLSDDALLAFIQHVPFLEQLRLVDAYNITDHSLQPIFSTYCPHLTTLYISRADAITQLSMIALGQHAHQLTSVTFEYCLGLDTDMFTALRTCPSLNHIVITRCHLDGMNNDEGPATAEETALTLSTQFPHLTSLRIEDLTSNYTALTTVIWPSCLTHLCLNACHDLDDAMSIRFLQHHPQLVYLELHNSHHVTDRTLEAMTPLLLPNVKEIKMHSMPRLTAMGIYRLVKTLRAGGLLAEGVSCSGCDIYTHDDDFPEALYTDRVCIFEWDHGIGNELWWVPGDAFDHDDDNEQRSGDIQQRLGG